MGANIFMMKLFEIIWFVKFFKDNINKGKEIPTFPAGYCGVEPSENSFETIQPDVYPFYFQTLLNKSACHGIWQWFNLLQFTIHNIVYIYRDMKFFIILRYYIYLEISLTNFYNCNTVLSSNKIIKTCQPYLFRSERYKFYICISIYYIFLKLYLFLFYLVRQP